MKPTAKLGLGAVWMVLTGAACDIALLPESASYDGGSTPRLGVVVASGAMPDAEVAAVDLEIAEIRIHRESDDQWLWIGGDADRYELSPSDAVEGTPVPLHADYYDRIAIVVENPRVATKGKWHSAELVNEEIELPLDADLAADSTLQLTFDVAKSLTGSKGASWKFTPALNVRFTEKP